MNRIADVFFIIALLLLFFTFNTLDYIIIFNLIPSFISNSLVFLGFHLNLITLISFFLFIGSIGKSAQIGFHT
jgi:NADH:ubiquinone oxidoreductase subunit 5 (subunit L)/multisubunit Na+/H+ antiporter MnhA subunit